MKKPGVNPKRFNHGPAIYVAFIIGTLLVGVAASIIFPLACKEDGSWINPETRTIGGQPLFACYEMYTTWIWAIIAAIGLLAVIIAAAFLIKKAKLRKSGPRIDGKR